ncbi:MAG: Type 1 glutamine amidotransferase-like domain-containing protein [Clostridiales bacterium]|nr:Type 1 glutamine amidotransferase-like domain-containing protein [Clostridiales bacterium]
MVIFLTSLLRTHYYDDNGGRVPVALGDENNILTNIRKYLKRTDRLVVVANNPDNVEDNDEKLACVSESFRLTGLSFKQNIMLDSRNEKNANEIVSGADLIILCGGKCVGQCKFFERIGLKEILNNYDGIVIGISAGSMALCRAVPNFPEEIADLQDPRWVTGMGIVDELLIPHYDGQTDSYQFPCEDFDIAKDYILPMSMGKKMIGLPNDSYILIDTDGSKRFYGDAYEISDGKSKKIH